MNGYSKIGSASHKSRSIDFSDFFSFPAQTPKPIRKTTTDLQAPKHEEQEPNDDNNEVNKKNKNKEAQSQKEYEEEGERFGVILGRSCSVSSGTHGFQATMKRAFSIRRSSSVSERYCRIHDQNMAMASDHEKKKQRRGGKILKTCKRLLGL